jgi:type I restriction enzyme S subunit
MLDGLKKLKQAYLQQMFPQNGDTSPRVRFAGFSGDWQEQRLGDVGETFSGLSGKTKEDFGQGAAEFVIYKNVFANVLADIHQTEPIEIDASQNEVKYGDVLFTTSSETPEEVGMSSVWLDDRPNVYLNSFCFGFRPQNTLDPYFMAFLLRSPKIRGNFIFLAQGISRYNISKTKAMDMTVCLPCRMEQQKIGGFFCKLDEQITAQQTRLDKLKQLKQAYLQRMFV